MGALVGPGLDENIVVELAAGTVMLNSRAKPYLLVAESRDGGLTYGPLCAERELIDPANNGAILRVGDASRRMLMFSNTADSTSRRRLTLRLSRDDGRTWPFARVLVEGPAAYSTLAELPGGGIAVLFERGDYAAISLARVPVAWVGRCGR